jgi:outer membrane protein assembly factor BamB
VDKNCTGISVADGKLLWQIPTSPERRFYNSATPLVDGETVIYTGQGTGTKAVKVEKQGESFVIKELWSNDEIGTSFNTPVLKDGLIYGISSKRRCVFCLNAETGEAVWTDDKLSDRFGTILDAGSVMLAVSSAGELIAFEPNNKGYSEMARIKIAETPIYAHPVIAGNRIYVKDKEAMVLFSNENNEW